MRPDLAAMRRAIRESRPRPEMVRRVYVLPTEMVARMLRYQADRGLPSETAAARELLVEGLRLSAGDASARGHQP